MQFAVRVPTSNRVASPAAIVDVAQAAEALGFAAVSVHDHLVFNGWWIACGARDGVGDGDDRDQFEALSTLSYLAGKTARIKLMTAILLLPTRETVLAAKQVATIDVLSGGRVLLGVGIGPSVNPGATDTSDGNIQLGPHALNARKEYETFKVPRQRGRLVDEQLQAMRAIWTEEAPSFAGEFVQFREIEVFPKPLQPGGPPILVGGGSAAAFRRVIAYGQGWLPSSISPAQYAAGVAELERLAAQAGKPPPQRYGLNIFATIAPTDEEALAIFRPTMGDRFSAEALLAGNLVGAPDTVLGRIREFQAAGVNLIELKPIYRSVPELLRMLELVGREIMPALA